MTRWILPGLLPTLLLAVAACSRPQAPDKEQPPEPKASAVADAGRRDDLARAVREPLDRARDAQAALDAAADARRAAVEAAEQGADVVDAATR
ncbi:hypothetical protein [Lysobacter sp. N42]|uniref:hypothetical protein n=1 Tax=Lysobacter sp. N42 TaxID=2545719 RepID=UPI0010456E80|nr:hypothetical protein [Lysobacter sp. N42]TCZ80489.1 hypothetical protein EYQ95_24635 [Lysobacter sp. N42]